MYVGCLGGEITLRVRKLEADAVVWLCTFEAWFEQALSDVRIPLFVVAIWTSKDS